MEWPCFVLLYFEGKWHQGVAYSMHAKLQAGMPDHQQNTQEPGLTPFIENIVSTKPSNSPSIRH